LPRTTRGAAIRVATIAAPIALSLARRAAFGAAARLRKPARGVEVLFATGEQELSAAIAARQCCVRRHSAKSVPYAYADCALVLDAGASLGAAAGAAEVVAVAALAAGWPD
jgi:hypothetical protein